MDQHAIIKYIADTFAGVDVTTATDGIASGDTFFIYDPNHDLEPKHQFPFATIVTKDYGEFDHASDLNRPGVFRLNIGVGKDTFRSLFGPRPASSGDTDIDYTALDKLLPHPVYAPQFWVCVLNPSADTFQSTKPLLANAYEVAVRRHARHRPSAGS